MISGASNLIRVLLALGDGSVSKGYPYVVLRIIDHNGSETQKFGSLPACMDLAQLYTDWQLGYENTYEHLMWRSPLVIEVEPDCEIDESAEVQFSIQDFQTLCDQLRNQFNDWLQSPEFQPIQTELFRLDVQAEITVTIEVADVHKNPLPWNLWNFFQEYEQAQLAFAPASRRPSSVPAKESAKVKILCIIGNTQGVDTQPDHQTIVNLPDADVHLLQQPDRHEITDQLWEQGWDVLFFAGHSSSQGGQGRIYLNNAGESLTIPELQAGLKRTIKKGLQLAIFNSCDGIGLAAALAELNIPAVVVMREPIPDIVAHHFLRSFLVPLAQGESLHMALRHACDRLQEEETTIPCASWLPTLYHNASSPPPTWQRLRTGGRISGRVPPFTADIPDQTIPASQPRPSGLPLRKRIVAIVLVSLLCTTLSMLIRTPEFVQFAEMPFYDLMMRTRPSQTTQDDRIVVIEIDRPSFDWINRQARQKNTPHSEANLPDSILKDVLEKLYQANPAVVGSTVARDPNSSTIDSKANLEKLLQRQDQPFVVAINHCGENKDEVYPDMRQDFQSRVGKADFLDQNIGVVRLQGVNFYCGGTKESEVNYLTPFSSLIALHYINRVKGSENLSSIFPSDDGQLNLKRPFSRWSIPQSPKSGGSILVWLNYKASANDLTQVFKKISLVDLMNLEQERLSENISGKIVLIGLVEPLKQNEYKEANTPYGSVPVVYIHAQMVSQFLDIVLDRKNLPITQLSLKFQFLWIYCYTILVNLATSYSKRRNPLWLMLIFGIPYAISNLIFWANFWLYLIPVYVSIVFSTLSLVIIHQNSRRSFLE